MLPLLPLLFALPYARADSRADSAACAGLLPNFSLPMDGDTEVPYDSVLAVLFAGDVCGGTTWAFTLTDADGAVLLDETRDVAEGHILLDAELAPLSAYTLTMVRTDDASLTDVVSFQTSELAYEPVDVAATVENFAAFWTVGAGETLLDFDVTARGIEGATWVVRTREWREGGEPGGDLHLALVDGTPQRFSLITEETADALPDRWCVAADVWQLNGTYTEGDANCVEVSEVALELGDDMAGCGCSGAAGAPGFGFALALTAALRRRRSSP